MFQLTSFIVILAICCVVAIAAPYQELAPKDGYVPVYIREGNTPLSEIHPKLVEAFHEDEKLGKLQVESEIREEALAIADEKENENVDNKKEEVNAESKESVDIKEAGKIIETIQKEPAKVEETTASDIAEFNSDDLKHFN